jgi:hypothetical protein
MKRIFNDYSVPVGDEAEIISIYVKDLIKTVWGIVESRDLDPRDVTQLIHMEVEAIMSECILLRTVKRRQALRDKGGV